MFTMKKFVITGLMLVGVLSLYKTVQAACTGPYCWDESGATVSMPVQHSGPLRLPVYTATQITTLAGPTTGQALISCFNCTQGPGICISTGATTGSWTILASTGGPMATMHCQ